MQSGLNAPRRRRRAKSRHDGRIKLTWDGRAVPVEGELWDLVASRQHGLHGRVVP
jgi:hypothetical protein